MTSSYNLEGLLSLMTNYSLSQVQILQIERFIARQSFQRFSNLEFTASSSSSFFAWSILVLVLNFQGQLRLLMGFVDRFGIVLYTIWDVDRSLPYFRRGFCIYRFWCGVVGFVRSWVIWILQVSPCFRGFLFSSTGVVGSQVFQDH